MSNKKKTMTPEAAKRIVNASKRKGKKVNVGPKVRKLSET